MAVDRGKNTRDATGIQFADMEQTRAANQPHAYTRTHLAAIERPMPRPRSGPYRDPASIDVKVYKPIPCGSRVVDHGQNKSWTKDATDIQQLASTEQTHTANQPQHVSLS